MAKESKLDKVRDHINSISPSFCAAKWYNATIWLSNGRTASCHHPEAHYIPPNELFKNPKALHNTNFKKEQRKLMLDGVRPQECTYCWKVEDVDSVVHSDRTYKSAIYTEEEINYLKTLDWNENVDPKTLEISFDNLCNLSCTYCNPEFSSTWSNDIKTNGIYHDMKTGGGQTYQNDGSHAYTFDPKNENNFFIKSFFKWFDDSLKYNLQELRVTGGEPTRSPDFWKLVEKCQGEKFRFAVNSNLMMDEQRLEKLIDCSNNFEHFDLYTSCETTGKLSEFVRHGIEYNTWISNLKKFAKTANYRHINIMMTISALSVFGLTDFMEDMINLRREFPGKSGLFSMSFNILRFPSFQSVNILPANIKNELSQNFENWLIYYSKFLNESELNQFKRVVSYLKHVDKSYEDNDSTENKINDFVKFFKSYANRRNLNITESVNNEQFTKWWNIINEQVG
jgi:organic radical activating enzyme